MTTREAYLAAGLEPKLYSWWRSTSTEELRTLLAELDGRGLVEPDFTDQLKLELDFRGAR